MQKNSKDQFTFEITEHICVLGNGREEGYTKEFNRVSFRGMPAKWDIREWNGDHTRMTKGMTLTDEELVKLVNSVKDRLEETDEAEEE